jgi:hypothetical protein
VKGDIKVTPSPQPDAVPPPRRDADAEQSRAASEVTAIDPAAIAAEIQALRRGRGLRGDVTGRIGPLLRELAAGPAPGEAAQVRRRLAATLEELSKRLPEDLRKAILAALALQEETRDMRTYELRREWVAGQVARVARTAERRIDEAQDLLAQEVAAELAQRRGRRAAVPDADQWHIESFSAVFMLDGETPEAIERRVIVSAVDGLTDLSVALDVPVDAGRPRLPLELEMIKGGELILVEEKARTRTRFVIRLPHALREGETHEYAMRIRVLPGGPMRDYYVFRPERRCDSFDLRVRFDRRRIPAWVRRVDGEDVYSYNTYDAIPADGERVPVDHTGEAAESFSELLPHYGFGLQWAAST